MAKGEHKHIQDKTIDLVSKKTTKYADEANKEPDILLQDSSILDGEGFEQVWIEVETSTIAKPGYIVKRVYNAAINDAKLVFAVPAEEQKSRDYYAQRIDTIVGPPELMHKSVHENVYRLYTDSNNLQSMNGGTVLIPEDGSESTGEWLYNDRTDDLEYQNGDFTVEIDNPRKSIKVKNPDYQVIENEENYTIQTPTGEKTSSNLELQEYKRIPCPVYPFDIPRTRLDKVMENIEYLIFSENVVYRREHPNCGVYDIGA